MVKSLFLAWTSPVGPEADADFNQWYEDVHVPDLRRVLPSITRVTRYRTAELGEGQAGSRPAHPYLAVYEVDSEVPEAAATLENAINTGEIVLSPLLDLKDNAPALEWYTGV